MEDTASTATTENQNELGTELSDEQMTEFVDKQIGPQPTVNTKVGWGNPDDAAATTPKPAENEDDKTDEDKPGDQDAKTPEQQAKEETDRQAKAAEDAKAEAETKAKEQPADIPAVDISDLWVDVEAYVLEGEGDDQKPVEKTVRISLDAGEIPDNVRFKNDKQLTEVLDALGEMRSIRADRTAEHDQKVADKETADAEATRQSETLAGWDQEIEDMTAAGVLDKPKAQPKGSEGYSAEEIAADPALTTIDNVFKFMASENEKRLADKKAPIGSFGTAYNLYMKQSTSKEEEDKATKEAEIVKKRGSMVGGASGAGSGGAKPDKFYRAGSAKSIWAVPTDDL